MHTVLEPYAVINEANESRLVLTAEHAGNAWPMDIANTNFPPQWQNDHSCYDIGMAELVGALAKRLNCTALLGNYSRLLVDLNRETDDSDLIAPESDGFIFPENNNLTPETRQSRIKRYYTPYQEKLASLLKLQGPNTIMLSLHSFTPRLRMKDQDRPWDIGVLFVTENDFSKTLVTSLQQHSTLRVGVNEPYDLRQVKGGTVRFHGEKHGILNAELEIRNDWFRDMDRGIAFWVDILTPILQDYLQK